MNKRNFRLSMNRGSSLQGVITTLGLVFGSACSDDDAVPELVYNISDGGTDAGNVAPTDTASTAGSESSGTEASSSESTSPMESSQGSTSSGSGATSGVSSDPSSSDTSVMTSTAGSAASSEGSAAPDTDSSTSDDSQVSGTSESAGTASETPTSELDAATGDGGPDGSIPDESMEVTSDGTSDGTMSEAMTEAGTSDVVLPPVSTNETTGSGGGGGITGILEQSDAGMDAGTDSGTDGGMSPGSDGGMDAAADAAGLSTLPASTSEMSSSDANAACQCGNGIQDGDETGIDCGGCCGACAGSACNGPEDCASGLCPNAVCITPAGEAPPAPTGALGDFERYQVSGNFVDLPVTLESSASVEFGNKVFILGGSINGATSDAIYEATVGNDGLFESFTLNATFQLATARMAHRAEIIGGYVYVFGGQDSSSQTLSTVERAPLGASGIAGDFEVVPSVTLTTARYYFATVTTPGYVYAIGGNFPQLNSIERATVDQNGEITSTFSALSRVDLGGSIQDGLNVGRWTLGVARVGQDVYFVGGESISSIERSSIQNDGSLGVFTLANPLPSNRNRVSLAILADTIYAFGGWAGGFLSTVESAPIVAGEIGTWSTTSITLQHPVENGTPLRTNAAVYLFGGSAGGATNYVQRALIQ